MKVPWNASGAVRGVYGRFRGCTDWHDGCYMRCVVYMIKKYALGADMGTKGLVRRFKGCM